MRPSASKPVPTTPCERYEADVASGAFSADPAQRAAVRRLQALHQRLLEAPAPARAPGLLSRLLPRRAAPQAPEATQGVYLWGSVGRGKTHLVDCFYDCLPLARKRRVHFHAFMQSVHRELRALKQVESPLERVAGRLTEQVGVLCLDEFHVSDITDAMILGNLLRALLDRGLTLVTTSNEPPERLYWQGLQRSRFLPAIEMLQRRLEVVHLDGPVDYRLRALERAPIYLVPADGRAEEALGDAFERIASEPGQAGRPLEIDGRSIPTRRQAVGVVWFDFDVLCGGPRSAADYIEIARCFHTVVLSGVPTLGPQDDDAAKRLMLLVDEFYDRNVNLVVSAAALPAGLYLGSRLRAPFARTASRLTEMQTHDYLAKPHISE